jgi:uncharacterized damage-inducible protein DinB
MAELAAAVTETLAGYYDEVRGWVHEWVDPLTTEQIWARPYPYGNSVGHILLHLTGNLQYYIGARIAGTGYVRNRPLEFTDAAKKAKEQVLADFDRTILMVVDTIRRQRPEDWTKPYAADREPESRDRFTAVFRCAAHAYHHVGQLIYLSKELGRPAAQVRNRSDRPSEQAAC